MAINKESITGYLTMSPEVARFENHLATQAGSLYYAPDVGFDRRFFFTSEIAFSAGSFNLWVMNQAAMKGIMILDSKVSVANHKLTIDYTLAGSVSGNSFSLGF